MARKQWGTDINRWGGHSDEGGGGGGGGGDTTNWGEIGGNIDNQTDLNNKFVEKSMLINSSADVRSYADSEDTKLPTEKFLQKTLHNIELPEADKDAANKKYVDDIISELSGKVLKFKGFIYPTAPTGTIKDGSLWYEGNALPTTFPINVKTYNATTRQWSTTTSEYTPESLDLWANLNDDKGYYWFGNGWNMIDDNGRFMYVSTFNGVIGNPSALYYLDTAYSTYEKGFYRFVEATTTEPEKFVILNKERFKYVSTFTGEIGDINRLYYLDTNYDEYIIGFYRYIEVEEAGVTVGKFIHTGNPQQLQVTYSKLKELRDNSMLIPGMEYRITDYACTTTQDNTQSANHPFDIIVTADSANTLNEEASAALHDGDTYFANNDLAAWKLKYCLDNDTSRFAWADATNGKGVIYYMKDEFNNECPYDFKNIMFKRKVNLDNGFPALDLTGGVDTWCYTFTATKYDIASGTWSEIVDGSLESPHGHMSDEGFGTYHHNIIKEYIEIYNDDEDRSKAGLAYLNDNVFLGYYEYNGGEGDYLTASCSYSNTFGDNCHSNTFGNYCSNNTFGDNCTYNTFGNDCQRNTFGNYCHSNTFGNYCHSNTFGNDCSNNTFGNYCSNNTFGNYCTYNTFGNDCHSNTFGDNCHINTFGNYCSNNTFGNNCSNNTFGDNCTYNTFGNYCHSNTFGNDCHSNTFGNDCSNNTFGNNCSNNTFGDNCTYNTFGDNCLYIAVFSCVDWCRVTGGTAASPVKNAQILSGTGGASSANKLTITFAANKDYTQYAAKTTAGKLRIWNIADIGDVEKDNIIDVTVLPTTDIDTDALYRLTTTHYYHNGTELANAPQGYKSLNAEALVADENGLTIVEGETSTTTPWDEVTDAIIANLVSNSLVAACEYGEDGFFKTAADEYDYAGNFSTTDTYTLWHNATGQPTDWIEVDSVSNFVTDGETTEDVDGELRANAIVDVTTLPTTGIKAKTLYRMLVHRYLEDGEPLAATPSGYVARGTLAVVDENGITDTGVSPAVLYPWNEINDDRMEWLILKNLMREVASAELMTVSTCFKTATNHYVYKDHVTEEEVYELYHNPTATAGEFVKVGGRDASVETDNVTTQEVNGKLQANAIIEVQTLPATGYKQNSLYRMLDTATQTFKRYYYNASADPLPETPTFYKGDGEHLVFGADGYTLNGGQGSYSSISEITLSVWMNNGWVSETTDFSEAGMFRMPGSLAVYDSTTKLTEEDYVVTAEMDKVFKRVQGGWECISYIQLEKEQYDILSEAQKNDGTLYIVNDEED